MALRLFGEALTDGISIQILIMMPTKMVYVREADLPILAEAERYATSFSAAVVEALRAYVERNKTMEQGFEEIVIHVRDGEHVATKQFKGRLTLSSKGQSRGHVTCTNVYLTAGGRYAVQRCDGPWDGDPKAWRPEVHGARMGDLEVYDTIDALAEGTDAEIADRLLRLRELASRVEVLDI